MTPDEIALHRPTPVNQEVYQSVAGILGASKDEILRDAIDHALGRTDWTLVEVTDRGSFRIHEDSGEEIFFFDDRPLVVFKRLITEWTGTYTFNTHYQYDLLYEE